MRFDSADCIIDSSLWVVFWLFIFQTKNVDRLKWRSSNDTKNVKEWEKNPENVAERNNYNNDDGIGCIQVVERIRAVANETTLLVIDAAGLDYYAERNITITSTQFNVQVITAPPKEELEEVEEVEELEELEEEKHVEEEVEEEEEEKVAVQPELELEEEMVVEEEEQVPVEQEEEKEEEEEEEEEEEVVERNSNQMVDAHKDPSSSPLQVNQFIIIHLHLTPTKFVKDNWNKM